MNATVTMGSVEVEGDSGRPRYERHLDLLDKFSQSKRQLEQLLDTNDLAQLDEKLQDLQVVITEVAGHLPAASLRWVQEQFGALRAQVDEVRERLKPRKRFAFKSVRNARGADGDARPEGKSEPAPNFPAGALTDASTVGFQGRSGETLMLSEVSGKDTELDSLENCQVTIQCCPATLFARRLKNCRVRCGPVASSVFVEECEGCTFHVACHQLRVHDSRKCEFRVHIQTRSIIEDSKELLFGKYDFEYDGDERDWCASLLDRTVNNWSKVDDFNWLATDKPSPNWNLLQE